jgi:hypothetical protein
MREIYECTGCQARFLEGEVKPFYLRNPDGAGHFIECPKCGKLKGVKDLRMPPPVAVPDTDRPVLKQPVYNTETIATQGSGRKRRSCGHEHHPKDGPCVKMSEIPEDPSPRGMSTATATVLGMVAALAPERPSDTSIPGGEQCMGCGQVAWHSPTCAPPRAYRKV